MIILDFQEGLLSPLLNSSPVLYIVSIVVKYTRFKVFYSFQNLNDIQDVLVDYIEIPISRAEHKSLNCHE